MISLITPFQYFNADQLDGLANLCFDLAKAALIGALLTPSGADTSGEIIFNIAKGLSLGTLSTYAALYLLKIKEAYE